MSAAPTLLPGQSPPLSTITATDRSALVLITTAVALTFALVSIFIRVYVRYEFSRSYASDDVIITAAMVFGILQSSTVFAEASRGLGKAIETISSADLIEVQRAAYASEILYIVTLWLTKCSIGFLFLRLSPDHRHTLVSKFVLGTLGITAVVSIFIVAIRCELSQPWIFIGAKCTGLFTRWQVVTAFDIFTEASLFLTSVYIIYGLQMSFQKKAVIVLAFGLRLPMIIPAAFRLHFINREILSSDPTFGGVFASIYTQIELNYAIIAATIPCLRPFMAATSTHYGAPASNKRSVYASAQPRSDNPVSLASLSSKLDTTTSKSRMGISHKPRASGGVDGATSQTGYGSDQYGYEASVAPGRTADQHSIESTESKQMFIRKQVDFVVDYEESKSPA